MAAAGSLCRSGLTLAAAGAAIDVGAVPVAVPEPSGMALLGLGAAGIAAWRARRKAKTEAGAEPKV